MLHSKQNNTMNYKIHEQLAKTLDNNMKYNFRWHDDNLQKIFFKLQNVQQSPGAVRSINYFSSVMKVCRLWVSVDGEEKVSTLLNPSMDA